MSLTPLVPGSLPVVPFSALLRVAVCGWFSLWEKKGNTNEGHYLFSCGLSPLASALLLTIFFASPLRANAQEIPSAFGMVFQPRPSATGTTFMDYDWTGLQLDGWVRFTGDPTWYPGYSFSHEYGGNIGGAASYWYNDLATILCSETAEFP